MVMRYFLSCRQSEGQPACPHGPWQACVPLSLQPQVPHLGRNVVPRAFLSQSREDLGRSPGVGGHGGLPKQRKEDHVQEGPHLSNGRVSSSHYSMKLCAHPRYEKAEVVRVVEKSLYAHTGLVESWLCSLRLLCLSFCTCKMGMV